MKLSPVVVIVHVSLWLSVPLLGAGLQEPTPTSETSAAAAVQTPSGYVLGPDDVIAIRALDAEEINSPSIRIDPSGHISLPMLGRLTAGGLTVEALEKELADRLRTYVRDPIVAVTIQEYRSQPVSVIGAVGRPGVLQLEGRKTLIEVLASAGGLQDEAGHVIKITRKAEWGMIPLPSAVKDDSGRFSVAEVSLNGIIRATSPEDNILILPNDVITVPRANLVYVIGEVKRPGGFVLNERRTISALHALAMANGFTQTAAPNRATIVRQPPDGKRIEIAANMNDILSGKKPDIELLPDDILFIPNSAAKSVLARTIQSAVSAITSITIHRVY